MENMAEGKMMKFILVDYEKCHGCNSCTLACSIVKTGKFNIEKANISIVEIHHSGLTLPVFCLQCLDPACMEACPAGAIYRNEENGAVIINENLCVGCKMCIMACPIGGPWIDDENHRIMKCDLCGGDPQCAKVCRYGALQYITAEDSTRKKRKEGIQRLAKTLDKLGD